MISPELLRRYPFFSFLDDNHLKAVAMIAEEENHPGGTDILKSGDPANALYLLMKGSVDLFYVVQEEFHPSSKKEFLMGEVNPEEPFGISALIEPYQYTASARAPVPVSVIKIDGIALRELMERDEKLSCGFLRQITKATMARLANTRTLLAAAWA
jgi:CRP/FNR family cyclic AMP-dependent transcriptional regulator